MKELLNNFISIVGEISILTFSILLVSIVAGYFFKGKESTVWRKIVAYVGNINTDIKPGGGSHGNKTIGA